ncbi:hypothetical protein, partial [Streptomyces decoyicus]|uniref:hypothetical protein n=1 Tax=Streptomyces decoyicus TaxID=249567 RepID=UPI0033A5C06D
PHHTPESAQDPAERRTAVPGVVTGLAVTGAGAPLSAAGSLPGTGEPTAEVRVPTALYGSNL